MVPLINNALITFERGQLTSELNVKCSLLYGRTTEPLCGGKKADITGMDFCSAAEAIPLERAVILQEGDQRIRMGRLFFRRFGCKCDVLSLAGAIFQTVQQESGAEPIPVRIGK